MDADEFINLLHGSDPLGFSRMGANLGLRISALIHGCALTKIREFKFDSLKILSLGLFFINNFWICVLDVLVQDTLKFQFI